MATREKEEALHCEEGERDDKRYYITDVNCEIYYGPPRIGMEIELTFRRKGEEHFQTRKFVVRPESEMEADVILPKDISLELAVEEGMLI